MDHTEAARKLAAEQYLLGEMSEAEREEFEEHFFACSDCADAVDTGAVLVQNARAVFAGSRTFAPRAAAVSRARWRFWAGWSWAPAAALAGWVAAALLGGYALLHSPQLETAQLTLAPAISVRAVRAGQILTFSRQQGMIALTVAHEWEQNYSGYRAEIERAGEQRVLMSGNMASVPDSVPLAVSFRPQGLEAGSYILALYGQNQGETLLERISFQLTE